MTMTPARTAASAPVIARHRSGVAAGAGDPDGPSAFTLG